MAVQSVNYSDYTEGWDVTIYWECEYGDSTADMWWEVNQNTYGRTFNVVERNNTGNRYNSGSTLTVGSQYYLYVYRNGSYLQDEGPFTITAPDPPEGPSLPDEGPSTITLSSPQLKMGEELLISIYSANPDYDHELSYTFNNKETVIAESVKSSYIWKVPDLAQLVNNATSGSFQIVCTTWYIGGSVWIGEDTEFITLNVPDATKPSISGDAATMGTECAVACKRNSANFTQKVEVEFKGTTIILGDGKEDTVYWTPSYDLAKLIPALKEGTGTLKCTTYNGTAEVGTETSTIRIIVPENEITRPVLLAENLTLQPVGNLPEAFAGKYLRGKTGLSASFTAKSEYSEIHSHSITAGGQRAEGNPAVIDLLSSEGQVKITAKVTDARGFSSSLETTIDVLSYRSPKVTPYTGYDAVVCERAIVGDNNVPVLSPKGTFLAIRAGRSYSSIVLDGKEQNSCILRYRWKPNSASNFSDWITLIPADSTEKEISIAVGNVVTDLLTSYLVDIEAADALGGKHTLTFQIMTEAISFVLYDGPDGAGFGKYPEAPHVVDIAAHMTLMVRGKLVVVGSDWTDLELADGIQESIYPYGRKEASGCHMQVSNGNHVYVAFDCSFAYMGTALTINRNPIPNEYRPKRSTFAMCPVNDRGIALVSVNPDGWIRVEWVQNMTDVILTASANVEWLDGYLDYWT